MTNELKIVPIEATKQDFEEALAAVQRSWENFSKAFSSAPQYPDKVIVDRAEYEGLIKLRDAVKWLRNFVNDNRPSTNIITEDHYIFTVIE